MPVQKQLPPQDFNTIIRWIKQCTLLKLEIFRVMVNNSMERLRLKPDPSRSVKGIPDGSDAVEFMSIKVWMDGVERKNKAAVRQIIAFDATLKSRMEL